MKRSDCTNWEKVLVGDELQLVNGTAFKSSDWGSTGLPIVRIKNLNDPEAPFNYFNGKLSDKFRLYGGELLFAWSGTPGTSFGAHIWRGGDAWLNQHIFNVHFDETRWDKRFLRLAINQNLMEYIRAAHGAAGLAHITKGKFEKSVLPRPERDDQRQIVAEIEKQFSRLVEGVGALKRVQANLKRYRAAVLKAACEGQLVPPEAELAKSKKRKFESGEELLARILAERRKNWQGRGKYKEPAAPDTSKLDKLPEGWAWASIGQLGEIKGGKRLPMGHDYSPTPTEHPYIRVLDFANYGVRQYSLKYLRYETQKEIQRYTISRKDVYISIAGSIGIVGVIPENLDGANLTENAAKITSLSFVEQKYICFWLSSNAGRSYVAGKTIATTQAKLALFRIETIPIPLPPLAEQSRIVAEVERRLSVVEELEATVAANLQRATRLRQSILQKAFEGRLVVNEEATPAAVAQSAKTVKSQPLRPHFARAILSAEIVHRLYQEPSFGRIKHQKIFHLCEHIARIEEIQGQYHREAAGPLDNKLIYSNEDELKRQGWFQEYSRASYGHAYRPMPKAGGHRKYVEQFWPDKLPVVVKLIELMRTWDTERCEIFCTAYAAWNDLILWGKDPTDDAILHEILDCWHESKRRIPEERWKKAIEWMKKSGFAPGGFGQPTKKIE